MPADPLHRSSSIAPLSSLLLFSCDLERDAAFPDGIPTNIHSAIAGVGIIDAALGTARIIEQERPERIIFIGTCGAHRESGLAIGDVVIASETMLATGDVAHGWMRLPSLLKSALRTDATLMEELIAHAADRSETLIPARVSCTLGITEEDMLASKLNDFGFGAVENMEAFGVLRAAGDIPTGIVLGITNLVGAGGGRDWLANHKDLMRKAAGLVAGGIKHYE